jgi:hypothetical protein
LSDELPICEINIRRFQQLADYDSIILDLKFAYNAIEEWANKYSNSRESVTAQALLKAGIVSFMRCFNSGQGTKLQKEIFATLDDGENSYEYIAAVRDGFIAHRDNRLEEHKIGYSFVGRQG